MRQKRFTQDDKFQEQKIHTTNHENYEKEIGVELNTDDREVEGYLVNIKTEKIKDYDTNTEFSCILMFFILPNNSYMKAYYKYEPYFYVQCKSNYSREVILYLNNRFENMISAIEIVEKENLELINHLSGRKQKYLRLKFKTVNDLVNVRNILRPIVKRNQQKMRSEAVYQDLYSKNNTFDMDEITNYIDSIIDLREDDVIYSMRVLIDNEIRCSFWYSVKLNSIYILQMKLLPEKIERPDIRILAFDIETTKPPLKFPDAKNDQIMMISYMVDGDGFLITNREVISQDIPDFSYITTNGLQGLFTIFNEQDERSLLERFFIHIKDIRPLIFVTYNGDYFDWPFIETRATIQGLDLEKEIGFSCQGRSMNKNYIGRFSIHMDCLYWVKTNSYLPAGSHGLKAVTKVKLGYDPVELDPELMVEYAHNHPLSLAQYSVSDAFATYYLYKTMIHDFIFALCTIISANPDDVLRLGSGTLCENLLMAQAYRSNIIFPNKHREEFEKFHNGHLIDTETYIGGHVEALKNGVYRNDIPVKFKFEREAYQGLIDSLDKTIRFGIEVEQKKDSTKCTNFKEVKKSIQNLLEFLRDRSDTIFECKPLIYHLDVAAMYPNIILTNRLQPVSITSTQKCAGCEFNQLENNCKRPLLWNWRGDYFPLTRSEFEWVKHNLEYEKFPVKNDFKQFNQLNLEDQQKILKERVKKYCTNSYKKIHLTETNYKEDMVCMRENPFYVDTVRSFRDRRYEYKNLVKKWKGNLDSATSENDALKIKEAEERMCLYESLQLAHKVILNSFYGYVMRRGARWYSMEMAGIVTQLGGSIITDNRHLVEQIGIPLELDTDGIWCLLPDLFPQTYKLMFSEGGSSSFSYPCTMLNINTFDKYKNDQYQSLVNPKTKEYKTTEEMSIFFEIDGPYRCIFLPAAREEGKMLKKRYAVFHLNGKLAELKGFELKRRGELKIIKIFQSEVFEKFLDGSTLEECYGACAEVAERWYSILESEGEYIDDEFLIEYIGESRVLKRPVHEYGAQKSTSITCAKRLAEFLGGEVVKDPGLNTKYLIAKKPFGKHIADRAIPTVIFSAEKNKCQKFLREWLNDDRLTDVDMRSIIDWNYYKERFGNSVQKIISIPALMQNLPNPIPVIPIPDWLMKKVKEGMSKLKQKTLTNFFVQQEKKAPFMSQLQSGKKSVGLLNIEDAASSHPALENSVRKARQSALQTPITKRAIQRISTQKKPPNPIEIIQKEIKDVNEACPPRLDDFEGWLNAQKKVWELDKKLRKEMKDKNIKFGRDQGLISYLRLQADAILSSNWHILQICETNRDGYLKVWFIAEHEDRSFNKVYNMFNMTLYMPRILYINSKTPNSSPDFQVAKKILPRGKKSHNLYSIELDEESYLSQFSDFYEYLSDPQIEGIYETKLPLQFKAIVQMGSLLRCNRKDISLTDRVINQIFELKDFQTRVSDSLSYLPSGVFKKVLISHSRKGPRHLFGVFIYSKQQANFYVLYENIKQIDKPNLQRTFKQELDASEREIPEDYLEWTVHSYYPMTLEITLRNINKVLLEIKDKEKEPYMIILQSEMTVRDLQAGGLTALENEYPYLYTKVDPKDNEYPALNWVLFAVKNMVQKFVATEDWLEELVDFSKMGMVPLCNMGLDNILYLIDILFAKNLFSSNHILSYNLNGVLDIGNDEDFGAYYDEEFEPINICNQGFYTDYCIEIQLDLLEANTILNSDILRNMESGYSAISMDYKRKNEDDEVDDKYIERDEFVLCKKVFNQLKSMLGVWLNEIQRGNFYADILMQNLYRWISSSSSKFYDPMLHKMIQRMIKKTFLQLIHSLRDLHTTIVYASFHKLIISTNKSTYDECIGYIDYVIQTIKAMPLFQYLNFSFKNCWKLFLFKDFYNYGGVLEDQEDKITSNWNIGEFLPPIVESNFLDITAEFIHKMHTYKKKIQNNKSGNKFLLEDDEADEESVLPYEISNSEVVIDELVEKSASRMDMENDQEKPHGNTANCIEYMKKLIDEHFSQKMFSLIHDLIRRRQNDIIEMEEEDQMDDLISESEQSEYSMGDDNVLKKKKNKKEMTNWEFPIKLSSHRKLVNPGLEFVNFTCHMFELEQELMPTVIVLKRNCLSILRIGEFSLEAMFVNPSLILIIPEIICQNCLYIRDLDLCREPEVTQGSWKCEKCQSSYDKKRIERRLIEIVNRRCISYQLQDITCKKCKLNKDDALSLYCECGGNYECTIKGSGGISPEESLKRGDGINLLNTYSDIALFLRLIQRIAAFHQMELLNDLATSYLQMQKEQN